MSRRLSTAAATAAIGAAILTGAGAAGWLLSIAYNGFADVSSDGAGGGRITSMATAMGSLVIGVLAVLVVAMVFVRQIRPRALHGRALVPSPLHRRLRRIHELSIFGVGAMKTWTAHNPAVALSDIHQPASPAWLAGLMGGADQTRSVSPSGTSALDGGPSTTARPDTGGRHRAPVNPDFGSGYEHHGRSSSDRSEHRGPVGRHVVARGDTLWTLAEHHLGDGARWTELRDLNVGREVAPGVVFEPGTSLRSGWELAIPAPSNS